jgi:hypothetical protein
MNVSYDKCVKKYCLDIESYPKIFLDSTELSQLECKLALMRDQDDKFIQIDKMNEKLQINEIKSDSSHLKLQFKWAEELLLKHDKSIDSLEGLFTRQYGADACGVYDRKVRNCEDEIRQLKDRCASIDKYFRLTSQKDIQTIKSEIKALSWNMKKMREGLLEASR